MTNPGINGSRLEDFWLEGGKLHPAEQKLLEHVARGEECIVGDGQRPVSTTKENRIRASFLRFLILGGDEKAPVHERGVGVSGAFVTCDCSSGSVDLGGAVIGCDIVLGNCTIDGDMGFLGSKAKTISLHNTNIRTFLADGLETNGGLFLRYNFHATGTVRLLGARISGDLDCSKAIFSADDVSLVCDSMEVKGRVFLADGFRAASVNRMG